MRAQPHSDGGCCYFIGVTYPAGQYILCGHEVLQRQAGSVSVPQGEFE
jgi:hypothetical protein